MNCSYRQLTCISMGNFAKRMWHANERDNRIETYTFPSASTLSNLLSVTTWWNAAFFSFSKNKSGIQMPFLKMHVNKILYKLWYYIKAIWYRPYYSQCQSSTDRLILHFLNWNLNSRKIFGPFLINDLLWFGIKKVGMNC